MEERYGARAERGVVLGAESGGWRVRSLDRPGVVAGPLFPIGSATISAGDTVWFLLAADGQGVILRSAPAGGVSETAARLETPRAIALTGDASGSALFDGSEDIGIEVRLSGFVKSVNGASPDASGNVVVSASQEYGIGDIYISTDSTSPALKFGGTWEQIENRFLLAAGSDYTAGDTGGYKDAVVVSHRHEPLDIDSKAARFAAYNYGVVNTGMGETKIAAASSGNLMAPRINNANTNWAGQDYTKTVGVSGTGRNMPPYLVVYMWVRVEDPAE